MTSHLLFDFFGTLVGYSASRTEQGYPRSFEVLREAGAQFDYEGFLSLFSDVSAEFDLVAERTHREFSMADLGSAFLSRASLPPSPTLVSEFVQSYLAEWNKGVFYLDGIPELLERLGGRFDLAVITNTHDRNLVPDHLERMGVLRLFEKVITSVEFGTRKPGPAIFRHALTVLDASPGDCVYVGDNFEADYRGAASAGMRAVLIDPLRKFPVPVDDRIDSILSLEQCLSAA